MVHSPTPLHESYPYDDVEDDDDTDASSADVESPGIWTRIILYCFSGSEVGRACGSKGVCHRCIPSAHKHTVETLTSHAVEGWYLTLPSTRKDSQVLDGPVSSYRSDEDHQADVQRRTDDREPCRLQSLDKYLGGWDREKQRLEIYAFPTGLISLSNTAFARCAQYERDAISVLQLRYVAPSPRILST
jgi:hypothetical protein